MWAGVFMERTCSEKYILESDKYICYTIIVTASKSGNRKEVNCMDVFTSLIVAVMGGVICHYIIKWLDGDN